MEPPVNYSLGREPWDVAVEDLNGDGKLDIATGNPNTVSILLNAGDGTFGAAHEYPAGRGTWAFAVGDLSGDGRPDIATANRKRNSTTVLVNRGDGSFGAPVDYRTGPGPATVAIGDVNGDGKADVVSANGSSDPSGDSASGSTPSPSSSAEETARCDRSATTRLRDREDDGSRAFITVRIADVNGDRKPDLVTADLGDNWSMTVFVNGGKGTFRRHFDYGRSDYTSQDVGQGSEAIALGDLNGDRRPDVVEARFGRGLGVRQRARHGAPCRDRVRRRSSQWPGGCSPRGIAPSERSDSRNKGRAVAGVRSAANGRTKGAVLPKGGKVDLVVGRSR